eukprot:TRINITY_DN2763_c0_g1_i1.p1 TRINITY_DN2763_c0_g1~~TRINITY_DN2763_c0_g1_i1.p1  ORF type:complete len:398 (+),score=74.88 TRINITY_DN2763_c0_g1_i1:197-1390(+)
MASIITNQPVVIDNGSGILKAGIAGESEPKVMFPSFIGRPKHVRVMPGGLEEERSSRATTMRSSGTSDDIVLVGERANDLRGLLRLEYAMEHGRVQNWEAMEMLWNHAYTNLAVSPEDHPVLLTDAPLNPRKHRDRAAEIFFETYNAPALFLSIQAVLSLFASGRTTGVVLDVGDGVTHAVPIYEGFAMPHAIQRINLAGRDVTNHLELLLRRSGDGHDFHTSAEHQVVRNIKETACYVAEDPAKEEYKLDTEGRTSNLVEYQLPDGSKLNVGAEAFRAPEILFKPELIGSEYPGVHQCVSNAIQRADLDLRRNLYSNIVLAGGSTLFPGFGKRLLNEVISMAPKDIKIKISAPQERQTSTWIGGSILASLTTFQNMWVSRAEYKEHGSVVIHRKCF